ncbi:phage protein, partial [Burkholderia cenocepacia]
KSLDLSQFRVRFQVKSFESQTPQHVEAYIYNLSRETEQSITKEYENVKIEAGYQDSHGLIFDGDLMQKRAGRENPADTYLAILARSGYRGNGYAVVHPALEKGQTKRDVVDACMKAFAEHVLKPGYISDLGAAKAIRGTTLFGMASDAMRTLCQGANASFNFENG